MCQSVLILRFTFIKRFDFRFKFKPTEAIEHYEIHTEVYVFGYIFTFAQNDGVRIKKVSSQWLFKTTKGQFGEQSKSRIDELAGNVSI